MEAKIAILLGESEEDTKAIEVMQTLLPHVKQAGFAIGLGQNDKLTLTDTIKKYHVSLTRNEKNAEEMRKQLKAVEKYGTPYFLKDYLKVKDQLTEYPILLEELVTHLKEDFESKLGHEVSAEEIVNYIQAKTSIEPQLLVYDANKAFLALMQAIEKEQLPCHMIQPERKDYLDPAINEGIAKKLSNLPLSPGIWKNSAILKRRIWHTT